MPIKDRAGNTCSSTAVTEKTRFVGFSGRWMACLWVGTVRTDGKMDREGLLGEMHLGRANETRHRRWRPSFKGGVLSLICCAYICHCLEPVIRI